MVPQQSLVAVHDNSGGLAILSQGLPAVNVRDDHERTIALSILRGFAKTFMHQGEEGGQILGTHEFRIAIVPFQPAPGWAGHLLQRSAAFRAGLRTLYMPASAGSRPRLASFLSVEPDGIQLSALKAAEDEAGVFVLRLYNPSSETVHGQIRLAQPPKAAWLANLNEERGPELDIGSGSSIPVTVGPRKIVTLLLKG
jgi:alpha-mannosidase